MAPTNRFALLANMSRPPQIAGSPVALVGPAWPDYALLDSGDGRKLERFGRLSLVRPEPQCLWRPALDNGRWESADAVFEPAGDGEEGRWRAARPLPASWTMEWGKARFLVRATAFRHLGVFPEQAAHWEWLQARMGAARTPFKLLNLFAYTGVASLVSAAAGAEVTHVDASRKAVAWARENATASGLAEAPIRWLAEDARKWVAREARRGARYDGILLDPPKFGRGPTGEVWRLLEDLPALTHACAGLISQHPAAFLLVGAYAERVSALALAHLLREAMQERGGAIEWGELALAEQPAGRALGLAVFARWSAA